MISFLPLLVAVVAGVAAPVVIVYGAFARWRGRRRNVQEKCARCGVPFSEMADPEDRYYVQGLLACTSCAARLRFFVGGGIFAAGGLVLISAGLVAGGIMSDILRYGNIYEWYHILLLSSPPVTLAGVLWGMVRRMKRANVRAMLTDHPQETLATGDVGGPPGNLVPGRGA